MYFSAYHFDGEPAGLVASYRTLMSRFPDIDLNLCVEREGGVTVYDTCPSEADFLAFSVDPGFRAALAEAGLPEPRVEPLGEVRAITGRQTVPR